VRVIRLGGNERVVGVGRIEVLAGEEESVEENPQTDE
jgi:hypothetical protein